MKKKIRLKIEKALEEAVAQTFSDMAFIDVVEAVDCMKEINFSHILDISFFKPKEGKIVLFMPSECKKMIVENIYGSDWSKLYDTEIDDCILEILNVLAGNFLNEYYGKEVRHDISLPELLFDETEIKNNKYLIEKFFDAEGTPFKVSIYFKK
jgi:CheY-specific phosphatase CheX